MAWRRTGDIQLPEAVVVYDGDAIIAHSTQMN